LGVDDVPLGRLRRIGSNDDMILVRRFGFGRLCLCFVDDFFHFY